VLVSLFRARFISCKSARIVTDSVSGISRGYGFVHFADKLDQQSAVAEMQGVYCGNYPIRISTATSKNKSRGGGPGGRPMLSVIGAGMAAPGTYAMGPPQLLCYDGASQLLDQRNNSIFYRNLPMH
jgi:RNA recognition motif-containing protein